MVEPSLTWRVNYFPAVAIAQFFQTDGMLVRANVLHQTEPDPARELFWGRLQDRGGALSG